MFAIVIDSKVIDSNFDFVGSFSSLLMGWIWLLRPLDLHTWAKWLGFLHTVGDRFVLTLGICLICNVCVHSCHIGLTESIRDLVADLVILIFGCGRLGFVV